MESDDVNIFSSDLVDIFLLSGNQLEAAIGDNEDPWVDLDLAKEDENVEDDDNDAENATAPGNPANISGASDNEVERRACNSDSVTATLTSDDRGSRSQEESSENDENKSRETPKALSKSATTGATSKASSQGETAPKDGPEMGKNAVKCRRRRAKRKAEREALETRNQELESKRPLYLKRIAELQQEVESLRMSGLINLEKENQLLRVEISKHKAYLTNITNAIEKSSSLVLSERVRMLKNVIDSATSQVVGMIYTSSQWTRHYTVQHPSGMVMNMCLQFLPRGVPLREVKRMNIRYEILGAPLSDNALHLALTSCWTDPEKMGSFYSALASSDSHELRMEPVISPEIQEATEALVDEQVYFLRGQEVNKDNTVVEFTFTSCISTRDFVPRSFIASGDDPFLRDEICASVDDGVVPCKMYASVSSDEDLEFAKSESENILQGKMVYGHVCVPSKIDVNQSNAIMAFSFPSGEFESLSGSFDIVSDSGDLTKEFARSIVGQFEIFADVIMGFAETENI
mmetsp:Transcript_22042/g.43335  ORF Transcript_22042/g.43335 Transcript_22042/m.43335 type:complete len:518 (-) Transcript_22042:440-1993(-)